MRRMKKGFTLTEILIAMAIFALGGVSIVGLFIANMRMARNAMDAMRAAEIMRNVRALMTASLSRPISFGDDKTMYRFDYPGTSLKFRPSQLAERESGSTTAGMSVDARRAMFGNLDDNVVFFTLPQRNFDATLWGASQSRDEMTTMLPDEALSRTGDRKFSGTPPEVFRLVPDTLRSSGVNTPFDADDRVFYSFDFAVRRSVSRSSTAIDAGGQKATLDDLYVVHLRVYKGFEYAADYAGERQTNKPVFEWDFLISAAK